MFLFSGKRTYYRVFLPTKGCTLYYLSNWRNYGIGDVVIVPCRGEEVPGVVLSVDDYTRWHRPVPLKQMKSIKRKAPYSIEYRYRKMQKELKKNTLDELQYLFENGLVYRQDEFLEYDYDDMVEMIEAECGEDDSDDGWDESEPETEDDIYSAFEKRVLSRIPELQVPTLRYPLENANYLFGDNLNYYLHWVAEYENGTLDVFTMLQIVELLYTALIDQMKRNRITIHETYMVCDIIEDILCPLDDFLSHFNRFADIYYITLVIHAECDVFRGFYFDAIEKFKNVYWEWKVDPDDMNYSAVLNRAAISIISLYNLLDMNDEALSLASFLHLEEYGIFEDNPLMAKNCNGSVTCEL